MGRLLHRVDDYEDHEAVYQPDGQPAFFKFVAVQEADGAWVLKDKRGALEADTVLGEVAGVLLLVPSKAHSDGVPTILHVRGSARQAAIFRESEMALR
jgi:hypothetical protein